ncbi:MAG: HEAT repeat domain-containing protein [Candidatus Binatia bacterium]
MSGNRTLSTHATHDPQSWQKLQEELEALLAHPLHTDKGITRTGKTVGLCITPCSSQDQIQLAVRFFPVRLAPAQGDDESKADQVALGVFLDGLQATDLSTRLAACDALGQLGHPTVRPALEAILQDKNRVLRAAARKALSALDTPRVTLTDLSDIPVFLWQQVKHLWKPVGTMRTNRRGEARFANISSGVVYRLQLLKMQQNTPQPVLVLRAQRPTNEELLPETLAAESVEIDVTALPQSYRLTLADGSLVCTVLQNDEEQLIVEFRTESSQLQGGWIYCRITQRETHKEILNTLVELTPNARGILSGRLLLSEEVDLTQACDLHFEPLPTPSWDA